MGSGYSKMKKKQKMMAEQLAKMQDEMDAKTFDGSSEGDLVKVTLSGKYELKSIKIDPSCVDPEDIEGLQDLIQSAFKDATSKMGDQSPGLDGMMDLGFPV